MPPKGSRVVHHHDNDSRSDGSSSKTNHNTAKNKRPNGTSNLRDAKSVNDATAAQNTSSSNGVSVCSALRSRVARSRLTSRHSSRGPKKTCRSYNNTVPHIAWRRLQHSIRYATSSSLAIRVSVDSHRPWQGAKQRGRYLRNNSPWQ